MKSFCCADFKQMIDQNYFLNEKEKWFDTLITHFEPTDFQIQTQEDYDVGGWIYIKFCPFCGSVLEK